MVVQLMSWIICLVANMKETPAKQNTVSVDDMSAISWADIARGGAVVSVVGELDGSSMEDDEATVPKKDQTLNL